MRELRPPEWDRCNIRESASIGVLKNGDCRLTNFTKTSCPQVMKTLSLNII